MQDNLPEVTHAQGIAIKKRAKKSGEKPGASLMIQGTTSDAGKSMLVAGLCRVLARRGLAVAPFKPQNMALNSAVTCDNGEIGRAQALQAIACGLEAHTDMNPVLLKPSSDVGAQVIIHGQAVSELDARAYHDYKTIAMQAVLASHERLCSKFQFVMVEGAGSPAEINLRDRDIANMGFAERVDCPVMLIADIDKGGVFAHLVGTLELLSPSERDRIIGFVINKFRGDITLLQPGIDWLQSYTSKPVLGVVPYLHDLYLDAEDAISNHQQLQKEEDLLRVVVPVYSRISNHTDLDALRLHPQVDVIFVGSGQAVPASDLILLPGSKNVRGDLQWLRDNGWDEAITRHLRYGGKLIGICGGYQMLGMQIDDPEGIEGTPGSSQGLGLLNIHTVLHREKQLRRVSGTLSFAAAAVTAYEIHCGVSQMASSERCVVELDDGRQDGVLSADGQILGTYMHGIFDNREARDALLCWSGLQPTPQLTVNEIRETQLERLADTLEQVLDIDSLLAHAVEWPSNT